MLTDDQIDFVPNLRDENINPSAVFYWYEKDSELYRVEVEAVMRYFPEFRLEKLDDGRLCWIGSINPNGKTGGTWTIMAVYEHNHSLNNAQSNSIKVYSVNPDLNKLYESVGNLPYVSRDHRGLLYISTVYPQDIQVGIVGISAATHLTRAVKWILMIEKWLDGDLNNIQSLTKNEDKDSL